MNSKQGSEDRAVVCQFDSSSSREALLTEGQSGLQVFGQSGQNAVGVNRRLVAQHPEPEHAEKK